MRRLGAIDVLATCCIDSILLKHIGVFGSDLQKKDIDKRNWAWSMTTGHFNNATCTRKTFGSVTIPVFHHFFVKLLRIEKNSYTKNETIINKAPKAWKSYVQSTNHEIELFIILKIEYLAILNKILLHSFFDYSSNKYCVLEKKPKKVFYINANFCCFQIIEEKTQNQL